MWTGEIREWYIIQGELTGKIYDSKNCLYTNWEYPDGTFISIRIYHFPDPGRLKYVTYLKANGADLLNETLSNYMQMTCCDREGWYWDVKQTGTWNPCPLHFKLRVPKEVKETHKFILKSGCMVSEYPIGYNYYYRNGIDYRELSYHHKDSYWLNKFREEKKKMTITEDDADKEAEVIPMPKLSVITGGRDNTGNWLMALKESTVFLCRHKKDDKEFILVQFHVKKKWNMAVWLHSNFPMHQAGDYFVHSLKFSQQHELVDIQQDGEPDDFRGQDEEGT